MRIVINALQYKQKSSGIGVMIRELFEPFTHITGRDCLVVLPGDGPEFEGGSRTETVRSSCRHDQGLRRIWFQSFRLGSLYCRDSLLLTTDSKVPFLLPKSCRVLPLITDLAVYRMKAVYQPSRVLLWRLQYAWLKRRADFYLAVSEFTKRDMTEVFGIPPEKIRVVPCSASEHIQPVQEEAALDALREKYGLPRHFVLFVGNNNPRKNLARMIRAFDLAKTEGQLDQELVIAGEQGWRFDREQALDGISCKEAVRFIGFVPDEDMPALYSAADLFVFPTLYEGFGIPVIEAQRCLTPVLAGKYTALPETGGDGAVYVDPYSQEDICRGIREILEDPELAAELVRRGTANARRFSWEASARRLNQILEEEVFASGGEM